MCSPFLITRQSSKTRLSFSAQKSLTPDQASQFTLQSSKGTKFSHAIFILVSFRKTMFYLGLEALASKDGHVLKWRDQSEFDFHNWEGSKACKTTKICSFRLYLFIYFSLEQPSQVSEQNFDCVFISNFLREGLKGSWNPVKCTTLINTFICERPSVNGTNTP